jgi:type I restriction enzyme R subunit
MKFNKEKINAVFTTLFEQEGFSHYFGVSINRKSDEVMIDADLRNFLLTQYAPQNITGTEANGKEID